MPSKKYIESKSFNLQNNSYLYRDKDFDGLVIYKDLTGKDVCGWQYKEGKITSYLLPAKVPQMNTKSAYLICQSEYTLYYTEWTYNNNDNVDYSNIYLEENTICWISLEVIGTSINMEVETFLAQYKYCKKNNQALWANAYKRIENAFGPYVDNPSAENYQLMVDCL